MDKAFFIGWFAIWIAIFFAHSNAFFWFGFSLVTFLFIIKLIFNPRSLLNLPKSILILLVIFIIFLLPFAFMPPDPMRTFEDFLKNYLFHTILALYLALKIKEDSNFYSSPFFYLPPALSCVAVSLHHIYSGLKICFTGTSCLSTVFIANNISLLKGLVVTSFGYVLVFFLFLGLYVIEKDKNRKLFFLFISLFSLIMEILLGRRASLLGIMLSSLIVSIFSQNKNIRKLGVAISLSLILLTVVLLVTPVGREMLIREDKVELLAQGKYAESGSFGMRLYIWPIYLKKALEDPFSGTGIGRKTQKLSLAQTNELALRLEHAHNLFLNLWLQAGFHTMLTFLILYLYTIWLAYKMWSEGSEGTLHGFLLAFLLAFFVMSMLEGSEEGTRFTPYWIASGLVWGFHEKSRLSS